MNQNKVKKTNHPRSREKVMENFYPSQSVEYRGRGFLGFNPKVTEMKIVEIRYIDIVVIYKGDEMSVLHHEIQQIASK
jgi:hypothetical protein